MKPVSTAAGSADAAADKLSPEKLAAAKASPAVIPPKREIEWIRDYYRNEVCVCVCVCVRVCVLLVCVSVIPPKSEIEWIRDYYCHEVCACVCCVCVYLLLFI